ncbi:MAG: ubiquitin carboxyl-terminal hydrolase [Candidatus Babeliaceae bacterium]|nr:ubiquitin carboxyl-terminal hydrolase [Candidatus Babeliaceae bacterium]
MNRKIFFLANIITFYINASKDAPPLLQNLRNTCYMNSVLQALFACTSLSDEVNKYKINVGENKYDSYIEQYYKLLREQQSLDKGTVIQPKRLLHCMNVNSIFGSSASASANKQQDASEFLRLLLDKLTKDEKDDTKEELLIKNSIKRIFEFETKNMVKCSDGSEFESISKSKVRSSSTGVEVSFPYVLTSNQVFTLQELFNNGITDQSDFEYKDDATTGPFCPLYKNPNDDSSYVNKKNKIISKWSQMTTAPKVLVITPKRFNYDGTKINNTIKYDLEPLSLRIDNKEYEYNLFASVIHFGDLASGHYTAVVKYGNQWYNCDDFPNPDISKISKQEAINRIQGSGSKEQGYIYFFERQGEKEISVKNSLGQILKKFLNELNKIYLALFSSSH